MQDWANIASVLRENNQWVPPGSQLIGLTEVRSLITAIWNTDFNGFPRELAVPLLRIMGRGATRMERFAKGAAVSNLVEATVAGIRAYLYCSKIRQVGGALTWRYRLGNLRPALLMADRARFFDKRVEYLEYALWQEIKNTESKLPKEPNELLDSAGETKVLNRLDLMADAAVVFSFAAILHADFADDRDKALSGLRVANKYFEAAESCLNDIPERRRLVMQRWARALMLEARLLLHSGQGGRESALRALDNALDLLKTLSTADCSDLDDPEKGWAAPRILQADVLISKAHILPEDPEIRKEVEEILREVILKRPEDAAPRKLLLDYYLEVKQSIDVALDSLDRWIEEWKGNAPYDERKQQGTEYLKYLAASLCSKEARYDVSLALPAVQRFAELLQDQPLNTVAFEKLMELLGTLPTEKLDEARKLIDSFLPHLSSENCEVTHAAIRVLLGLCNGDIKDVSRPSTALVAVIRGRADLLNTAHAVIEEAARKSRPVRTVLELLSKEYVERGRRNPVRQGLEISNRLLDVALKVDPQDVIWLSRTLEVARLFGLNSEAEALVLLRAKNYMSHDPILKLQQARLLIARGSLDDARSVLRDAAAIERNKANRDVHPAILDQLAYIAFQGDDLAEATELYEDVLSDHPYDPRAHFGLGRVNFERGVAYWPKAFGEWLAAARAQALNDEPDAILWRTARLLAGLCDVRYHKFSGALRRTLLGQLQKMQRREDPVVASCIVEALQILGIVDRPVVLAVLDGVSDTVDRRLIRSVAQFLMGSTIHGLLGGSADSADVRRAIDWCRQRGVLAEYLAGAKGSYGRALMRVRLSGRSVENTLGRPRADTTWNTHWSRLYEHLTTLGYQSNYYASAYRLVDEMNNPSAEQFEEFIQHLVPDIAHRIWTAVHSDDEALLGTLMPNASLCPLRQVLSLDEHVSGSSAIGGWVDPDALQLIEHGFEQERDRWHIQGTELLREISSLPSAENISAYTRGGLYFRQSESTEQVTRSYYYIDLLSDIKQAA